MQFSFSGSLFVLLFILFISKSFSSSIHKKEKSRRSADNPGLYNASDFVQVLTSQNFKENIYNNEKLHFLEFYNSWCGFCQRFAPSWKELAERLKYSRDLVSVAAIDCSNEINNELCRNFEIMGYPTLRYFRGNYIEGPSNLGMTVKTGEMNPNSHMKAIAEVLITEQRQGNAIKLPNLLPYTSSEINNIFENLHGDIKHVFLIIEDADPLYLGVEAALRYHNVLEIMIRYSYGNNTSLISNLGVKSLPAIVTISRSANVKKMPPDVINVKNISDVTRHIEHFLEINKIKIPKDDFKTVITQEKSNENEIFDKNQDGAEILSKIKKMGDVVFLMDLETTLRYSLKREISRTKVISGEKLTALKNYLNILRKYFPAGKNGQAYLEQLYDIVSNAQGDISGKDLSAAIKESETGKVFASPLGFLGCRGSDSGHRGYPCGVWMLFHYLTVNAAEQNQRNPNRAPLGSPGEVLNVMHGYIKNFFGCADCSTHFQKMAEERKLKEVNSYDGSILWLWAAHNVVNKRLAGDVTEDPEFPKYQYPSATRCPTCRYNLTAWNESEVLKYLKHVYSNTNVRYIGSDTSVLKDEVHREEALNSGDMITAFDRSNEN